MEPSVEIINAIPELKMLKLLELCGRTSYKSESKITETSAVPFILRIVKAGHESVLEHATISVRFICDRGVTHELVRHRIAAYTQESTRYCNYRDGQMIFISPCFWNEQSLEYDIWLSAMCDAERYYNMLLEHGCSPQQARSVLPNSLKTEIVATMNIRQWRHVIAQRTDKAAHPQMRQVMGMLKDLLKKNYSVLFGDL